MRKNKRRKKRLKTALILLIILFILAGFGGMLFVSHKNKIEKEQRKEDKQVNTLEFWCEAQ